MIPCIHIRREIDTVSTDRYTISAAQCRMARAAVRLSVRELADAANVAPMTISRFENEQGQPIAATLAAIRAALEASGVEFIPENGGGVGVRFRTPNVASETLSARTMKRLRDTD